MADVFISYKREERESARRLADALTGEGYSVWWDAEILPGEQYRTVTLEILQSCRAAIVIWSAKSVASSWVLDEAQRALDRGVLVPVLLEPIPHYPLGFGQVHAHDLVDWTGDAQAAPFKPVLAAVRRLAGERRTAATPRSPADVEAEVAFWRGVQDSSDVSFFETYLGRYPDGLFAELAKKRIVVLQSAAPQRTPAAQDQPGRPAMTFAMPKFTAPAGATPGFTTWELAFIAFILLVAGCVAWPIANIALGVEAFYATDYSGLFWEDVPYNVYFMVPLLTGIAWLWDRGIALWRARGKWINAPYFVIAAVLVIAFAISLGMRDYEGKETHFVLWFAAAIVAASFARRVVSWLRAGLLDKAGT